MCTYSLSHLSDRALLRDLAAVVAQDRATTAHLLAHIAEVDARQLYLPAAYPSMFAYCVGELRLCEQAAFKRIRAARTARQFPAIFPALAAGRLHLSAVVLLTPYLTPENADELLAAAAHHNKSEIELLLAQRFPRPEVPARVQAIPVAASPALPTDPLSPGTVEVSSEQPAPRAKVAPLAPQRFALQLTIGQSTCEKLRYAQALLGHQIPAGEIAAVIDRALDALIGQLEKSKFAATRRPRPRTRRATARRTIPAEVKRAVWERDGGQCTFVSDTGQRCPARSRLEFDHADPVARGGAATVERMRLLCRAHNEYAAECTFGTAFMSHKRQEAQAARARAAAAEKSKERDVIPWLRQLGFRADEARHAAAQCESIPEASLEERVRLALSLLGPPCRRVENHQETAT